MKEDFSWVNFYPAVCNGIKKYASDRRALVAFLFEKLPEETTYLHNPEGVKVTDIDPFTFLGVMNRHISDAKKSLVAQAFKEFFDVKEPTPQNFHGIPPLSNENSMFFPSLTPIFADETRRALGSSAKKFTVFVA